jgi:AraC family transcriptional regulator, ethanolamine operon transcriptional activator
MLATNLVGRPAGMDWMGSQPHSAATNGRCSVEKFPSGSLISVDTADPGDFCDFAADWSLDHQPIGAQKLYISVCGFSTPRFELAFLRQAGDCCWQGVTPGGTISLGVPLDGSEPISHCGRSIGKLQMAITRSGEDFEVVAPSGARHLVASFAQERVEKYAADIWREPHLLKPPTGRLRFPDEAHRRRYVGTYQAILGDVGKRPKLLSDARSASALEEKLLESLFVEGCADEPANERNRYQVARRAYRHLLDATEDVPTIRELCVIAGASYSTLERGYRETYGMAPQAHIKAMRLSRARKDLLHPADNVSVTSVAVRWGFFELGRFSVQYRQRFGESPSETLRQARAKSSVGVAPPEESNDSY